ncbi:MAG: hypothetical protein GF411_03855 [Candidatus Lokiarchaeota archaeon]|nr:hypothetical protein [Candidatus Lokiarchaeota archaeon]
MIEGEETTQDMTLFGGSSLAFKIALGAIFSGIYGVFLLLPMSTFIGAGSIISFAICIAPLFGILFDFRWGFMFGLLAGVIGLIVSSIIGGLFLALPNLVFGPALAGLFVGLSKRSTHKIRELQIPGPLIAAIYLFVVIAVFLVMRPDAWWFMVGYFVAALCALTLQIYHSNNIITDDLTSKANIIPLVAIGTFSDFSMMTLGSIFILDLPGSVFGLVIFPFMLIERTIAIIISTLLAIIAIKVLKDYL